MHAGEYDFTARLPVRMELTHRSQTGGLARFKIPNGACYEFDVNALPTGHIHGAVLGPDGKPLGVASVELYRAGTYNDAKPGLWGFQGAQGQFDLDHVGPGEYILVFNRMNRTDPNSPYPRAFYPGVGDVAARYGRGDARRRHDVAHRHVRSGIESRLLGHRKSRARGNGPAASARFMRTAASAGHSCALRYRSVSPSFAGSLAGSVTSTCWNAIRARSLRLARVSYHFAHRTRSARGYSP